MRAGQILTACGFGLSAWALAVGSAAADPEPEPAPAPDASVEGSPAPADPFAVIATQTKDNPVATLGGLLGYQAADSTVAAANPIAMVNQGVGLTGTPPVDPLASVSALYAHNYRMPSGEEDSPYVLQTDVPPGPFARVDALKGLHAMLHGSLGRVPRPELGQALPGTAPPPGTNLPAGLEQFYVPPDAPAEVPPAVPPFPEVIPVG